MEEESWRSNHGGGIKEKESWRRNQGEGIKKKESRGGIMEELWRRNHGGGIMEDESWRRHLGGIWEASVRHLGSIWEASGRHLGGIWEAGVAMGGSRASEGIWLINRHHSHAKCKKFPKLMILLCVFDSRCHEVV